MYGVQLSQDYTEPLWGDSLVFTRNSWYSLSQSRKDERLRWPWNHPVVLNLFINVVITKYKLKLQFKLFQLWPLTVNCFKVSYQSYLAGLSKVCFLCIYVDQMIIQKRLLFCFKFSFTIFLLMFFPIFSNLFTDILKIYELPKIYNKILKKLLTMSSTRSILCHNFIWLLKFIENVLLGAKDCFDTKKILGRIFF